MPLVAVLFALVGAAIIALGLQRRVPTWLAVASIVLGAACMSLGVALVLGAV